MRDAGDVKEMEDPAYWWRESWLPIGKHGGGDCLIADLAPGERDFAPLRTWAAEAPDEAHELAAPSLSAAVSYWIAALESGCCRWAAEHEYPHWEVDRAGLPPRPPGLSPFLS